MKIGAKILRWIKSACLVLLIAILTLLVSHWLLSWFNQSWETRVPVLDGISFFISAASDLGARLLQLLDLKWTVPIVLGAFLVVGVLGIFVNRGGSVFLIILSFCVLAVAYMFLAAGKVTWCYIALGAALLPLITQAIATWRQPPVSVDRRQPRDLIFLAIVLFVAIVFRFYQLDIKPAGILNEAAGNAYLMRGYMTEYNEVFNDHWNKSKPLSWNGNLAVALCVLSFKLYGLTPLAYKFVPAFFAVVAVVALFFLTRLLFGGRAALLAAFFLATSTWNTFSTRNTVPQLSIAICQSVLTYLTLIYAFKKRSYILFAVLGVLTGLSVYVYAPGKVTGIGAGLFTAALFIRALVKDHHWTNIVRHLVFALICCATLAFTVTPYVKWGLKEKAYFYSAAGPNNIDKAFWENKKPEQKGSAIVLDGLKSVPPVLVKNRALRIKGGDAFATQARKGAIDPVAATFVAFGLWWSLANIRRRESIFLLGWILVGIIPGVLTEPMPKRLSMVVPALYLAAGLGAERLWFAIEKSSPKVVKKFVAPTVVFILMCGILCYNAREYFVLSKYPGSTHPSIVLHRQHLYEAADETDMYCDIGHSIMHLIMFGHSDYKTERDLGKERLNMLEASQRSSRPLSVVGDNRFNAKLFAAWRGITPEHRILETKYFTIITLTREGLDELFKFSPATPVKESGVAGTVEYVHRGSLVVPKPGKFEVRFSDPVPNTVELDGKRMALTDVENGASMTFDWLSVGAHQLDVITPSASEVPTVSIRRADNLRPPLPFLCGEAVHSVPGFDAIPTRDTNLIWPHLEMTTLEDSLSMSKPSSISPASDGFLYVTDSPRKKIHAFRLDGSMHLSMVPGEKAYTMARSLLAPDGNILIARPVSSRGVVKFDRTGKQLSAHQVAADDIRLSPDGGFYAIRNNYVRMFSPSDDGNMRPNKTFKAEGESPAKLISMNWGPGELLFVLSEEAEIFVLDRNLKLIKNISLRQNAVNKQSRVAIDDEDRIYVTDYDNSLVRIFDSTGTMLVGGVDSNCPIEVQTPVDIAIWQDKVIVLARHNRNDFRFYTYQPPKKGTAQASLGEGF
jgi:hypothetical protein